MLTSELYVHSCSRSYTRKGEAARKCSPNYPTDCCCFIHLSSDVSPRSMGNLYAYGMLFKSGHPAIEQTLSTAEKEGSE